MWYFIIQILCVIVGAFIFFPLLIYSMGNLIWAILTYDED